METSKDWVEQSVITTLGFWWLLHEKADEFVKDLIENGKVKPEEGKHFVENLSKRVDEEKEEIKKKLGVLAKKAAKDAGCVTKKDIDKLASQMKEIEKRIADLET